MFNKILLNIYKIIQFKQRKNLDLNQMNSNNLLKAI